MTTRVSQFEKQLEDDAKKAIVSIIIQLAILFGGATLLMLSLGWQLGLGIVLMTIYLKN